MDNTCVTCKHFYTYGSGYSNYTWECTLPCCALNQTEFDGAEIPYDWEYNMYHQRDNWPVTNAARCTKYEARPWPMIEFDVDGDIWNEHWPKDYWETMGKHHWGDYYYGYTKNDKRSGRPTPLPRNTSRGLR